MKRGTKRLLLNGLIGIIFGLIIFLIPATGFRLKYIYSYLLANVNNAIWETGTILLNLLLFFILGIFFIPLIKLIYWKIRKQHKPSKKESKIEERKSKKEIEHTYKTLKKPFFSKISLKKVLIILFTIIIMSFLSLVISALVWVPEISAIQNEQVIFGAHRGSSIEYIENTLPAFEESLKQEQYNFVEFDVQYTKDKQMIVFHDNDLLRLQKLPYIIKDLTYKELLNVSEFHIPLYTEVMDLLAGKKPLMVEIKSQGNLEDDKKMTDFLYDDFEKRGISNTTLLIAISSDVLEYAKQIAPNQKTGKVYYISPNTFLHFDFFVQDLIDEINRVDADYLLLHGSNLNDYESIKNLMPLDKTLVFWFFDDQVYIVQHNIGKFYNIKPRIDLITNKIKELLGIKSKTKELCYWNC